MSISTNDDDYTVIMYKQTTFDKKVNVIDDYIDNISQYDNQYKNQSLPDDNEIQNISNVIPTNISSEDNINRKTDTNISIIFKDYQHNNVNNVNDDIVNVNNVNVNSVNDDNVNNDNVNSANDDNVTNVNDNNMNSVNDDNNVSNLNDNNIQTNNNNDVIINIDNNDISYHLLPQTDHYNNFGSASFFQCFDEEISINNAVLCNKLNDSDHSDSKLNELTTSYMFDNEDLKKTDVFPFDEGMHVYEKSKKNKNLMGRVGVIAVHAMMLISGSWVNNIIG